MVAVCGAVIHFNEIVKSRDHLKGTDTSRPAIQPPFSVPSRKKMETTGTDTDEHLRIFWNMRFVHLRTFCYRIWLMNFVDLFGVLVLESKW